MERLNRRIRQQTHFAGSIPDVNSALMLFCAILRHVAGAQRGNKTPEEMEALFTQTFPQQIPEAAEEV